MRQALRTSALAIILLGLILFAPPLNRPLIDGLQVVADLFDQRPERSVLFIGNSRTFFHDMPKMVRKIADSAGFSEKLRIEMHAPAAESLAAHWANPEVQALLDQSWNHVVFQVQSGEQLSDRYSGQVWQIAANLIREAEAAGAAPAMFVTWRYTDQCSEDLGLPASAYAGMHRNIQQQHARLARTTGVDLVNVGLVWEHLLNQATDFSLYQDCNHPSIYGSYLSALMFYAYLSGGDVDAVRYSPDGIEPGQAELLRSQVSAFLSQQVAR